MEIQGPGEIPEIRKIIGKKRVGKPKKESKLERGVKQDEVKISFQAKLLNDLAQVPDIRHEKVQEIKKLIEKGEYVTSEKLEIAVERLLDELRGTFES